MAERQPFDRTENARHLRDVLQIAAAVLGSRAKGDIAIPTDSAEFAVAVGMPRVSDEFSRIFLKMFERRGWLGTEAMQKGYTALWNYLEALMLYDQNQERLLPASDRVFLYETLGYQEAATALQDTLDEEVYGYLASFYYGDSIGNRSIINLIEDIGSNFEKQRLERDPDNKFTVEYSSGVYHAVSDAWVLAAHAA